MAEASRIDFRSHSPPGAQASELQVRAARVAVMYSHGPMLIFGALFTGALAVVVLWHSEPAASLLSWLAVYTHGRWSAICSTGYTCAASPEHQ